MDRSTPSLTPRRARPASMPWLDLLVDSLAAYRLTRLATADIITEPARRALVDRAMERNEGESVPDSDTAESAVEASPDPPKIARLVTCRWCAGVWLATGVVAARRLAPRVWDPAARALALSAVAVLIASVEDD